MPRPVALLPTALVLALASSGRGNAVNDEELETQLTGVAASELRGFVEPEEISIDCPDDIQSDAGVEFECAIDAGIDSGTISGTMNDDEGGYDYGQISLEGESGPGS